MNCHFGPATTTATTRFLFPHPKSNRRQQDKMSKSQNKAAKKGRQARRFSLVFIPVFGRKLAHVVNNVVGDCSFWPFPVHIHCK